MNIGQLEFVLEHLMKRIRTKIDGAEDKSKFLSFIYKYSIYYVGNRNYLLEYEEKQTTLFGLFTQLKTDILQSMRVVPPLGLVMNVAQVQEWVEDLHCLLQN
jgi:hypothetical protein